MQLGRLLGLLEAGVIEGHLPRKDADAAANLIEQRYKLSRVRDILLRGDVVTFWRVPDVAAFLGMSLQRVDQLRPFPSVSAGLGRVVA
jgi:hypothetical protein